MATNGYRPRSVNSRLQRSPPSSKSEDLNTSSISYSDQLTESDSDRTRAGISVKEVDPSHLTIHMSSYQPNNKFEASLRAISCEYDIQMEITRRLQILQDFEIVIVCDDSGSMKTTVDGTQRTRWDELCSIVKIVLNIGVLFDANGVDIHFLNRGSFHNVKDLRVVDQVFAPPPSGYTPLVPVLSQIFHSPISRRGRDKKLLVFVATDGVPTDENGNDNVPELEHLMREKRRVDTTYVSFLICTDEPACVSYLNEWNQTMKNVDVTDDFNTERNKIWQYHGNNVRFSFGDYVVKALVGAIDPEIDALNKPKK